MPTTPRVAARFDPLNPAPSAAIARGETSPLFSFPSDRSQTATTMRPGGVTRGVILAVAGNRLRFWPAAVTPDLLSCGTPIPDGHWRCALCREALEQGLRLPPVAELRRDRNPLALAAASAVDVSRMRPRHPDRRSRPPLPAMRLPGEGT